MSALRKTRLHCKRGNLTCHSIVLALLLINFLGISPGNAADSPNIVWITAEDMSPTLGCYGDEYATTPHIDQLATESVRYTKAFATAPVCSPSRACLITGVLAPRLGTHQMRSAFALPEFIRGFPALLRDAGYYTTNNVKTDYNTSSADRIIAASWDESSEQAHWRRRADKNKPFFSVFNLMTSHQSRSMVWTQERFRNEVQSQLSPSDVHDPDTAPVPAYYPDNAVTRRIVARYYDCVTVMDQQVGKILQELAEDGLADNTIVFFYSDHGSGMPRHKRLLHDSGMHIPLLIRFPARHHHLAPCDPGETSEQLVSFVDFPPTVLNLAGVDTPAYMRGIPFLGATAREREYVFGHRDRIDEVIDLSRSIRDGRYLYIRNFMPHLSWNQYSAYPDMSEIRHEIYRIAEGDRMTEAQRHYAADRKPAEELYDCQSDPSNLKNLAGSPEHGQTRRRLQASLRQFLLETKDLGFIPEQRMRELTGEQAPFSPNGLALASEVPIAIAAAENVIDGNEATARNLLQSENPSARYWGAIGLAMAESLSKPSRDLLFEHLGDASDAVRIEVASTLARHGHLEQSLPALIACLDDEDLTVVLRATRAIELLGKKATAAEPAMRKIAQRADQLQAADTPAVFVQSGDKDLAMFCSFSANAFLQRIKLGDWQLLSAKDAASDWENAKTDAVRFIGPDEISMTSRGKNLWIVHNGVFDDFELTLEAKMPPGEYNAGIGFRCELQPNGRPKGYQCEVANELSGMLYAIDSGGWIWPRGDKERAQFLQQTNNAFRPTRWNDFRIRCEGHRIQIWVNGILATEVQDTRHARGRIALQHHGKGGAHQYRSVQIRRITN